MNDDSKSSEVLLSFPSYRKSVLELGYLQTGHQSMQRDRILSQLRDQLHLRLGSSDIRTIQISDPTDIPGLFLHRWQ